MSDVLVNLSDSIRLSVESNTILLEENNGDSWSILYRYAFLGDALQGYVRYMISKLGRLAITTSVMDLLEAVQKLDATVDSAYNNIIKALHSTDPVERSCFENLGEEYGTE